MTPRIELKVDFSCLDLSELSARLLGESLLTPVQLAKHWQISERTLDTMIAENEVAYRKIGRMVRFKVIDVLQYEESKRIRQRQLPAGQVLPPNDELVKTELATIGRREHREKAMA